MGPLINQLLEEATARTVELAQRADAIAEEAAEIQQGAGNLGKLVDTEAGDLHREMLEALQALEHARDELVAGAGRASEVMEDIPGRGDQAESAVNALRDGVGEDMTQLADLRGRLMADVDKSREMVDSRLQELADRVERFRETLESGLRETAGEVEGMAQAVENGRARLADQQLLLRNAIHSLPLLAADRAPALAACLHAVIVLLGRNVHDVCERVVQSHNDLLKALRAGFTGESPGSATPPDTWVHESLDPLLLALQAFGALREYVAETLGDWASFITQNAYATVMSLGDMAVQLEQAVPDTSRTSGA